MATLEARSKAAHFEFDREYEKRERGLTSRCGEKRDTNLKQQELEKRLYKQGQQINQLERLYQYS